MKRTTFTRSSRVKKSLKKLLYTLSLTRNHPFALSRLFLKDRLFNGRLSTFRKKWDAYPVLTPYPFEEWPRIKLQGKKAPPQR